MKEDPRIEDWLANRAEADGTKGLYRFCIDKFIEFCRVKWKEDFYGVVDAWRQTRLKGPRKMDPFLDRWTDIVRNYSTTIKPHYAPLTTKNHMTALKSFFRYWKIPVDVDLPKRAYVIFHNRDMTREDVRQILTHGSPRDRVLWLVMAESGMRGQTAVSLKYWQIREDFEKAVIPMRILTPAAALKDHVGDRWTFIGEDGFKELKEYLKPRLPLQDNDYVFASERQSRVLADQFTPASLSTKFNRVVQKLGIDKSLGIRKPKPIRMHGLRKYFRNNMKAESAYREFWMGHSLGVDAHYITRDIEVHRKEYMKGYEFLQIFEPSAVSLTDLLADMRKKTQDIAALKTQNDQFLTQITNLKAENREMSQQLTGNVQGLQEDMRMIQSLLKQVGMDPTTLGQLRQQIKRALAKPTPEKRP
jgi:integrase